MQKEYTFPYPDTQKLQSSFTWNFLKIFSLRQTLRIRNFSLKFWVTVVQTTSTWKTETHNWKWQAILKGRQCHQLWYNKSHILRHIQLSCR